MLHEEFESRIGYNIPAEVYRRIEALYTESTEDKDTFARRMKRENTVQKIQSDIIREQERLMHDVERYLKRTKARANESYDNERTKALHDNAVKKIGEGTPEYYAWNNHIGGLFESCVCTSALEILHGKYPISVE